uniref:Uncharacterized protein n=1 Tax=Anopheles farauti TaxID=69004 RepID=A0A182QP60_9DIPT
MTGPSSGCTFLTSSKSLRRCTSTRICPVMRPISAIESESDRRSMSSSTGSSTSEAAGSDDATRLSIDGDRLRLFEGCPDRVRRASWRLSLDPCPEPDPDPLVPPIPSPPVSCNVRPPMGLGVDGDPFMTNRREKYSGHPRAISSTWRFTIARTCCFAVACPLAVMPWLLSRFTANRFSWGDIRMQGVTPNTSDVIWLNSRSSAAGAVTVSLGRKTSLRTRNVQETRLYVRQAAAGAFRDGFICTGITGAGGSTILPSSIFSLYTEPLVVAADDFLSRSWTLF